MVGYKWVLKYIITNNLAAPALAPHGTINNDVIYAGTLKLELTVSNVKNSLLLCNYIFMYKSRMLSTEYQIILRTLKIWVQNQIQSLIRSDN